MKLLLTCISVVPDGHAVHRRSNALVKPQCGIQ